MLSTVSISEGEVTRTWHWTGPKSKHHITLIHDTLTGVRVLLVDSAEVPGSIGDSLPWALPVNGHSILFKVEGAQGEVNITRNGYFGISYSCKVENTSLTESTMIMKESQQISPQNQNFVVSISETVQISHQVNDIVTWFEVESNRAEDSFKNRVCRRFQDFIELNQQIRAAFKGHVLFERIPKFPQKHLKLIVDHTTVGFVQTRRAELERYLRQLVQLPYVSEMIPFLTFLGIIGNVREFSVIFPLPTLGIVLAPSASPASTGFSVMVQNCQDDVANHGLLIGDFISKINGQNVSNTEILKVTDYIRQLPRPIVIHFVQFLSESGRRASINQILFDPKEIFVSVSENSSNNYPNEEKTENNFLMQSV